MKQITKNIVWLAAFLPMGSIGLCAEPFAKGPYLGQTPPGPVAKVFAPGLICDTRPHQAEGHASFSVDGNTLCFGRQGYSYITENTDQGWTRPKRIRNIPYKAWSCYLSPDANTIYFLDQRFLRSERNRSKSSKHIYQRCMRSSPGWSMPKKLGPPFTSAWGGFSVTADHSICFKSGRNCFRIAPFVGNTWDRAIELPVEMGNLHGCDPGIAPDQSFLVFYSIAPGARGGTPTDLYLTLRRPDDTWTKPHRMGPGINTEYYEIGARISPDKKYMFFTRSNGWNLNHATDTADIYWVELKDYLREARTR
jgi:WD40-like Beta Propeller Repeat